MKRIPFGSQTADANQGELTVNAKKSNMKKRVIAALCVLCLALTGCGAGTGGVASDHPDRTEFVSVAELKIDAVSETASYSGPEYMDGTVCVYDSFAVDPNGSYSFNPYGTGATGVTTPMVLDLQTGEVRELGISFPYIREDGTWYALDPYQELYWYRDGLWYLILEQPHTIWGIFTYDETTGELATLVPAIPNCYGVDSVLLAGDTLYLTTSKLALQAVDLNTGEITEVAQFEELKNSRVTHMILLDCTEQTLYLKAESERSTVVPNTQGGITSSDGNIYDFRVYAVDRATGEVTATTYLLNARSVSNACGRLLCFVDLDEATINKVDLVTGEVSLTVKEKVTTRVDDAAVCGLVLINVNRDAYLYDLESGDTIPMPLCGFEIIRLIRETPSHVVFKARTEDGVDYWVADRAAFEEGRMDATNTFRLIDRLA